MKGSKNLLRVSPKEYARARNSARIVLKKSKLKPIMFKNLK
jgi:hypothetical protein